MYRSRTISISIRCPHRQVCEFLAEPLNLPTWGSNMGATIEHVQDNDWASVDESGNRTIYRYHPRNEYCILDHAVFREGETPFTTPMRIVANDDGAEVIYTIYLRPGMTEETFESEAEWVQSDLLTLKALLEDLRPGGIR